MEYVIYYVAGVFGWAFFMSILGERVDKDYILSALIWPIGCVSVAGQIVRKVFGKNPFK